jgi:hypothetical protein
MMSNDLEKPTNFLKFWSSARNVPVGEVAQRFRFMLAAVVYRPSSSIYLLEPAESKIGQEIFGKDEPRNTRNAQKGSVKNTFVRVFSALPFEVGRLGTGGCGAAMSGAVGRQPSRRLPYNVIHFFRLPAPSCNEDTYR